jgi:hypothetical protein
MSLFNTSTGKGVKFQNPGDSVTGTVTRAPFEQQSTKFGSTELDFWPNGDPKMQILVPMQTQLRDDAEDDGERTLYVSSTAQKRAIGDAITAAGVQDVEVGGTLTITFTGFDPASKNPQNPKKLYAASYLKPSTPLATAGQPPVAQQAYQPPVQQQAAPPVQQQPPMQPIVDPNQELHDKARQLIGLGLSDEQITQAIGLGADVLTQLRAGA